MTVTNRELAPDLSTRGCFPKAWIREKGHFRLLKDGGEETVRKELLASQICQCFDIPQVKYQEYDYQGQKVTESMIVSSKERSLVSKAAFEIYAVNHDLDVVEICKELDPISYYGMNILDYLIGNTDRHSENWGFWVDNMTNEILSLHPLMDFNQSFLSYDTLEGANCLTMRKMGVTQKEAALEAVGEIGLRQIREVNINIFGDWKKEADMFKRRLALLQDSI